MMEPLDIHNSKKRIEYARAGFHRMFSAENARVACEFLDRLRIENRSLGRISNYAECTRRILLVKDDKRISEWTKKEIESIHKAIAESNYQNSVKKDILTTLKRLYHFAAHDELADKSRGKDYDPNVSWIIPRYFKDRYEKIQAKDLLTDLELERLFNAVKEVSRGRYVKRNIAMVFTLFEGSYRPGELFNIRIGGLQFEDDFVRVDTTGKTGPKRLSLVPGFQGITKRLYDTLFGLSLVPIFSALVMVTGAAYLGSITTHPVEEQWFASVAVLTLSTFIPTILVPLLGSLFSSITSMASTATGFGGMMGMMAIQGGKGIGSGAYGAAMSAQQGAAEMGQSISGIGMVKAAMGGGLAGGFGGISQGLSNVGSHALRRVGAKDLAYDMRGAGSQIMKTSQDMAHQYGNSVIQPVVDHALTENSAGVMTRLATIPVPEEQARIHLQNGATLLNLAHDSIETGNYSKILDHQYFKSVPVRDTQSFAKAVSATIVNHGLEPQKLANISYNLEKMCGLTSDNVKDFIQNFKVERSLHQKDKSQTLDQYTNHKSN